MSFAIYRTDEGRTIAEAMPAVELGPSISQGTLILGRPLVEVLIIVEAAIKDETRNLRITATQIRTRNETQDSKA